LRGAFGLWTSLALAAVVVAILKTHGTPVCEGPFIDGVNDSYPPTCTYGPGHGALLVVGWLFGVALICATYAGMRRYPSKRPAVLAAAVLLVRYLWRCVPTRPC
jgi:hypothetical protein